MSKTKHHSLKSKSVSYTSQDIDEALIPFEQALVAHFPSKEQIILRARQRRLRRKQGVSALLMVVSSSVFLFWWNPAYQTQQWTTKLGETRKINLSDGSQIHLNTDSKVLVKMHLRSREIQLQQGEATFHVGHLPNGLRKFERPFTVQAGQLHIEDIGTVFNVHRYSQHHAIVTVLQGKVRVSTRATPTQYIDLEKNQSIENHATLLGEMKYVNAQAQTAWHDGVIKFDHMPLGDVIREFQRYATFQVDFNQPQAEQLKISGSFDAAQSQQFIELLPNFAPVQVRQLSSGTWQISTRKK
ncbi:DUF4974 domain-containing protein [Acinetobacter qingfengensis]|uniref:FecR protein domain-containing protein n=1 Tax=Acinetobacter qingfengensis TaxID=1262585 RepID=A0A1E7R1P6_9GAMM|nr:FecR domain-containing protein [Acinetobacter qingfengensis]KAA8730840.1 DUF4974 domain-containing protein [Acinetobacter qingfengensis]OEY93234.1 hypothetical protein BJI46_14450 [Acinetobacter qingfengensis]